MSKYEESPDLEMSGRRFMIKGPINFDLDSFDYFLLADSGPIAFTGGYKDTQETVETKLDALLCIPGVKEAFKSDALDTHSNILFLDQIKNVLVSVDIPIIFREFQFLVKDYQQALLLREAILEKFALGIVEFEGITFQLEAPENLSVMTIEEVLEEIKTQINKNCNSLQIL